MTPFTSRFPSVDRGYPKALLIRHYRTISIPTEPGMPQRVHHIPYYTFTRPAARLLSLVSGVSEYHLLEKTMIVDPSQSVLPAYDPHHGGGGITLGDGDSFRLQYTKNFFEDDPTAYGNHGYGQDTQVWLRITSHEVMHINQNIAAGSGRAYIWEFVCQYVSAGNHDGAPHEAAADKGTRVYDAFSYFCRQQSGDSDLITLLESAKPDNYKVARITELWQLFLKAKGYTPPPYIFQPRLDHDALISRF